MESKHEQITRTLREELATGHYGVGGRIPSETQLVRRFSVSRPTVGRALRTLVEEGLIERRPGSGTFAVGRSDNGTPQGAKGRLLALLMPDFGNTEIFQLISGEIASLARVNNYHLLWSGSSQPTRVKDVSRQHAESLCEQFIDKGVAGVFLTPYELIPEKEELNRWMAVTLREAGIPVVLIDRDISPFPLRSDFDVVGVDNLAGGYMLAEHFIKLGCRRVAFVMREKSAPTASARAAGFREAFEKLKSPGNIRVHEGDPSDLKFVKGLLKPPRPHAIACTNDHTAARLMQTLDRLNVKVPNDIRVTGFDDVVFATLVSPPLTTVQQPCRKIGQLAFRAMLSRLENPTLPVSQINVAPRLVVRDTCGAYLS